MTIEVRTKLDFKKMAKEIRERQKKALEEVLEETQTEIIERTGGGQDVNGAPFPAYTPEYARFKSGFKAPKKLKSGKYQNKSTARPGKPRFGAGKVDLNYTGKMLAAIRAKVTRAGAGLLGRIYFNNADASAKARGHMEGYRNHNRNKIRKFFALSDAQIKRILERLRKAING